MWFKILSLGLLVNSWNTLGLFSENTTVLPGFHITIKSNNSNNLLINDNWNKVNDTYLNFIKNDQSDNLIKLDFDKWDEIINQQTNNNPVNQKLYSEFINQINTNENLSLLKSNEKKFGTQIIGRNFANLNFNPSINSFGSFYIPFYDSKKTEINNSLFATINPKYDFNNYFSVPYTIEASKNFLSTHKDPEQRIVIIALNGDNRNPFNGRQLVIFVKDPTNPNEQLFINNDSANIQVTNNVSYAILDYKENDQFTPTKYIISIKDSTKPNESLVTKTINIENNTSQIQFFNNNNDNNNLLEHEYLSFNDLQANNLIVMNEAKDNAKVKLFGNKSWFAYDVDPNNLVVNFKSKKPIDENTVFRIKNIIKDDYQVYYLQQDEIGNTGQYLVIYKTTCPNFNNWINFNSSDNQTINKGFQQYLSSISNYTNNDIKLDDIEKDPSEFVNYFIDYQRDLTQDNYINYFGSSINQPWKLDTKYQEITLVNNWKVIIIAIIIVLFLILTIPGIIFFIKKEKRLK